MTEKNSANPYVHEVSPEMANRILEAMRTEDAIWQALAAHHDPNGSVVGTTTTDLSHQNLARVCPSCRELYEKLYGDKPLTPNTL